MKILAGQLVKAAGWPKPLAKAAGQSRWPKPQAKPAGQSRWPKPLPKINYFNDCNLNFLN